MQQLWYSRLGHPSSKALDMLQFSDLSNGVFDSKTCEVCIRGKQTRESFPLSSNKTTLPFKLIHCDILTELLLSVDQSIRAVWVHLLPSKQNAPKHLKDFVALVKRQFATQVKTLRSDNESEFICLRGFFSEKGIIHETSCMGTPQQNGKLERKHRHLLNVTLALMLQASLPVEFWSYCPLAAGYLINRTPTEVLKGKSLYEILYNKPPPMQHLKVFGCLYHVHNQRLQEISLQVGQTSQCFLDIFLVKRAGVFIILKLALSLSHVMLFSVKLNFPLLQPRLILFQIQWFQFSSLSLIFSMISMLQFQ